MIDLTGHIVLEFFLGGFLAASVLGMYVFRAKRDKPTSRVLFYLSIGLFVFCLWAILSLIAGRPVKLGSLESAVAEAI